MSAQEGERSHGSFVRPSAKRVAAKATPTAMDLLVAGTDRNQTVETTTSEQAAMSPTPRRALRARLSASDAA